MNPKKDFGTLCILRKSNLLHIVFILLYNLPKSELLEKSVPNKGSKIICKICTTK